MRDVPLESLTFQHFLDMKEDGVAEGQHLDFKRDLPDRSKNPDFHKDVCAFANAGGGDLVYGIEEATDASGQRNGAIGEFFGLGDNFNYDVITRRLASLAHDGLEPAVSLKFRQVDSSAGPLLVVRVARSFAGPHRVKETSKFHARVNAQTVELNVGQLRTAFLDESEGARRARNFRLDRIARILSNDGPVLLRPGARLVLHIAPVRSGNVPVDVSLTDTTQREFTPIDAGHYTRHRHNLDGLVAYVASGDAAVRSYAILFREGQIESANVGLIGEWVPHVAVETAVTLNAGRYIRILRRLGVDAPLAIGLSFLGANGLRMESGERPDWEDDDKAFPHAFDRSELLFPEVVVDTDTLDAEQLKPVFDVMWQSAGWPGSANFHPDGTWKLKLR